VGPAGQGTQHIKCLLLITWLSKLLPVEKYKSVGGENYILP
jgi:hypothetical protein